MKLTIKINGHALKCACSVTCKYSPRQKFTIVKKHPRLVKKT